MIFGVLALALFLRLVNLNQGFWLDEAIGTIAANKFSYWGLINQFAKFDFHPPLYYILIKAWGSFWGYSEISIRSLSVIFGILTILVVFEIAKNINKLNNVKNNWPLISALFLATAPLHIYYSQEARMYALAAFLASVSVYVFIRLLIKQNLINWVLFSLSLILLISSDYMPLLLLPMFLIIPVFLRGKINFARLLFLGFSPLVIVGIFWLPVFSMQLAGGNWLSANLPGWSEISGGTNVKQLGLVWVKFILGRISFTNKYIYGVVFIVSSLPVIAAGFYSWIKKEKYQILIWLWFFGSLVLCIIISFFVSALTYFRLLFILPAFYLIIAWGSLKIGRFSKSAVILIILVNLLAWSFYIITPNFWREDWRGAVSLVDEKAGNSEIALFEFPDPPASYQWYQKNKLESLGALTALYAKPGETEKRAEDLINGKNGVWYFEYLRDLTDPQRLVEKKLQSLGFREGAEYSFRGVGKITHFKKYE